jgi:hypothetical protein
MTNCPYCGGEIPSTDFAVKSPKGDYWHMPCADAGLDEFIALREENDLQRDSIQQLSAQVAGYRNILKVIHAGCTPFLKTSDLAKDIAYACYKALSNPDPGAEIMDRMKKLEAVAEAAKELLNLPTTSSHIGTWEGIILHDDILERMSDALADLEGDAHE